MHPLINKSAFGNIVVDNVIYDHDIFITLDGQVLKRKKKLSKAIYGTSHTISIEEAKYVYQKDAEGIIIGTGQYGVSELSDDAINYFQKKKCKVKLLPTPQAIQEWNNSEGLWLGLFHVTC